MKKNKKVIILDDPHIEENNTPKQRQKLLKWFNKNTHSLKISSTCAKEKKK